MSFDKFSHGILASPAARFKPMESGVCRIRKAWRNWRCGVVCLTLFDKAVYKCLHWFLLEKRLFMHRYALQNQVVSWWTVVLPKPLVFFSEPGFRSVNLLPGNLRKTETPPWQLWFERLPVTMEIMGTFSVNCTSVFTPGEMLLFSLAIVVIDAFQNTRRSKLSFGQRNGDCPVTSLDNSKLRKACL